MPALPPYLPARDINFDAWLNNFASLTTATPAAYGLSVGDAATIAAQVAAWTAAYTPILSPATKTATAVAAKVTARVTVAGQVRTWAQGVANNPGVSSSDKVALGLNPRTTPPSPITAPASNPVLMIQSASSLAVILRYRDAAASPSVKAKPFGVIRLEIRFMTSVSAITDPTDLVEVLSATKSPAVVQFDPSSAGKQAYFAARWATRTGLFSPWSPIISFTVPIGT